MKTAIALTFLSFLLLTSNSIAQSEIKIKSGIVYIDGVESLTVKYGYRKFTIMDLEGKSLVVRRKISKTEYKPDFVMIVFLTNGKSLTRLTKHYSTKALIRNLMSANVLMDGEINTPKIDDFINQHDQKIPDIIHVVAE